MDRLNRGLLSLLFDGRYMIEFEDAVDVCDYKGKVEGVLQVHIQPCNVDGSLPSEDDDMFVEDPYVNAQCLPNVVAKARSALWC